MLQPQAARETSRRQPATAMGGTGGMQMAVWGCLWGAMGVLPAVKMTAMLRWAPKGVYIVLLAALSVLVQALHSGRVNNVLR